VDTQKTVQMVVPSSTWSLWSSPQLALVVGVSELQGTAGGAQAPSQILLLHLLWRPGHPTQIQIVKTLRK